VGTIPEIVSEFMSLIWQVTSRISDRQLHKELYSS